MKPASHTVDGARLGIMLNELRLPTIKTLWPRFAEQADREAGLPPASLPRSPSMNWPSVRIAGSRDIWPRPICRPERPSTASPSKPCP